MSKVPDRGLEEQQRAHARSVTYEISVITITLRLPHDIAGDAIEIHRTEPELLERVVRLAITRRQIYRGIRERAEVAARG